MVYLPCYFLFYGIALGPGTLLTNPSPDQVSAMGTTISVSWHAGLDFASIPTASAVQIPIGPGKWHCPVLGVVHPEAAQEELWANHGPGVREHWPDFRAI